MQKVEIHPYIQEAIDRITSIMDEVMLSHIGSDIPPYKLTNEAHIGAILIGMGIGTLEHKDGEFSVKTEKPTEIQWDGKKFAIIVRDRDQE